MAQRRKIEVLTAGCPCCTEAVQLVEFLSGHRARYRNSRHARCRCRGGGRQLRHPPRAGRRRRRSSSRLLRRARSRRRDPDPGDLRRARHGCAAEHAASPSAQHLAIPILGQLALAELPLGDALEAALAEVVGFETPLGRGPLVREDLEHAPRRGTRRSRRLTPPPAARHSTGRPWEVKNMGL